MLTRKSCFPFSHRSTSRGKFRTSLTASHISLGKGYIYTLAALHTQNLTEHFANWQKILWQSILKVSYSEIILDQTRNVYLLSQHPWSGRQNPFKFTQCKSLWIFLVILLKFLKQLIYFWIDQPSTLPCFISNAMAYALGNTLLLQRDGPACPCPYDHKRISFFWLLEISMASRAVGLYRCDTCPVVIRLPWRV